jgi:diguanylate cyclase (GGDEF)-like protein
MNVKEVRKLKRNNLLGAGIASIVLFAVLSVGFLSQLTVTENSERISYLRAALSFQSDIKEILLTNLQQLEGFRAWLEIFESPIVPQTREYLRAILSGIEDLVINVSVIQDTTIVWNHPKEGNESALGLDLTTIETQRAVVQGVKDTGLSALAGPVALVQGGSGFILRMALRRGEEYWGQISMVLDADKVLSLLTTSAEELNIAFALYHAEEYPQSSFYGEGTRIAGSDPVETEIQILEQTWMVAIIPNEGWTNFLWWRIFGLALSGVVAFSVGILLYLVLFTRGQLEEQANRDSLTGLFNRNYLRSYGPHQIAIAKRTNSPLGVVLIDLNLFKPINDTYGHKAGDQVLKSVGYKLKRFIRKSEAAFRLGGDEFLVMFSDFKETKDMKLALDRLKTSLKLTLNFDGQSVPIRMSFGAACYPRDGQNMDEILNHADQEMYKQKKARS